LFLICIKLIFYTETTFKSKLFYNLGVWKSKDDISKLRKIEKIFYPNKERQADYEKLIKDWKRAIERFKSWY